SYRPGRPSGLVVFMHGGGKGSPRTAPDRYMKAADTGTPLTNSRLGDLFEAVGMVGVGPSAPWDENDNSRWCLPEADNYLADVIQECKARFRIDPDRVFLWGHSMGGFGAYHQVQRQPDRFAAVIGSAGAWALAYWPVIHGTTFCIVHGATDATHGVRGRDTDIAYGRWADRLLSEKSIAHVFKEHPEGHPIGYGKQHILEFFEASRDLRRDPFFPHVVLASPVGWVTAKCYPVRHNRWVTLDATREGDLEYDAVRGNGKSGSKDCPMEQWNQWELRIVQEITVACWGEAR
ncbi:MAG TPA: alpha/beta hydrolase, partial [Pirellulales bacterium]|nr:alpha/beta hydrolase [Pirellulales bacterium]